MSYIVSEFNAIGIFSSDGTSCVIYIFPVYDHKNIWKHNIIHATITSITYILKNVYIFLKKFKTILEKFQEIVKIFQELSLKNFN